MKEIVDAISAYEARVEAVGASLSEFLAETNISRSSWYRWKRGSVVPNLTTWTDTRDALELWLKEREKNGSTTDA